MDEAGLTNSELWDAGLAHSCHLVAKPETTLGTLLSWRRLEKFDGCLILWLRDWYDDKYVTIKT